MSSIDEDRQRALRAEALESLLTEKGLVDGPTIDGIVSAYANDVGPMNGAAVVARAWTDADYRRRLLDNATDAIAELGFGGPHAANGLGGRRWSEPRQGQGQKPFARQVSTSGTWPEVAAPVHTWGHGRPRAEAEHERIRITCRDRARRARSKR